MAWSPSNINWQALAGLASGNNVGEQFANMNTLAAQSNAENKTLNYLNQFHPEIAKQVQAGMPMQAALAKVAQAEQPKQYPAAYENFLLSQKDPAYAAHLKQQQTAESRFGLNPQYGVDAQGNPVILQLSDDGTSKQTQLPEGISLSKQPIKLDAGTHFVLLDPITRQQVGIIPKNVAEVEKQKVIGETEGKNLAAASADLQAGINAKEMIQKMKVDPNRETGTGWSSVFNSIPGTAGYDFQTKVDQAKSGAFLTAIQQMRGLGALSNSEGQTATAAVTRMNTATSEQAFMEALDDYEKIIDQGIARAQSRLPGAVTQPDQAQQPNNVNSLVEKYRSK